MSIATAFKRLHYPTNVIAQCVRWYYLYHAIDRQGKTLDFLLTKRRNMQTARRFFKNAISKHTCPIKVMIDKSGANKKAIESFNVGFTAFKPITIRQNKYLNNRIEQDHRFIKKRVRTILDFKSFRSAKIILSGIELMHILRKDQFDFMGSDNSIESLYQLVS